jgi:hypothetical protein
MIDLFELVMKNNVWKVSLPICKKIFPEINLILDNKSNFLWINFSIDLVKNDFHEPIKLI